VSAYFDPARIAQLQQVLGDEADSMVASMLASLTEAIEHLESAMAGGELEPAIQAAHAARNDALMLGADRLQAALSDLEAAARNADDPRARNALARVRVLWPPTRDELASSSSQG
jgi:HPt (histidine-containing phosphotransfer) domain-containing protein